MARRSAFLILSLAALPAALSAQAGERWVRVAENNQGPIYIDTRSVVRAGSRVAAWYRTDLQQLGENGESEWLDRREVDCAARTIRLLAYVEHRPDGSVAESNADVNGQVQAIPSNSVGEAMHAYLCGETGNYGTPDAK